MSYPNILIIEPDFRFARKLQDALKERGYHSLLKTEIKSLDELLEIGIPVHQMILNVELGEFEGLTVYGFVKEKKAYKHSHFTFLSENANIYRLMENIPLERAQVIHKDIPFNELVIKIINHIPLPRTTDQPQHYFLEISGDLKELSVNDILLYCENSRFSGRITLSNLSNVVKIFFEAGAIHQIDYKDYSISESLELLKNWQTGYFMIERRLPTVEDIRKMGKTSAASTVSGLKAKSIDVALQDVFLDIFNFLYDFLSTQLPVFEVDAIFMKSIRQYQFRGNLQISFSPGSDDVFLFNREIRESDTDDLIYLLAIIFNRAKLTEPDLHLDDWFDYIHELKPYLDKINYFHRFRAMLVELDAPTDSPDKILIKNVV